MPRERRSFPISPLASGLPLARNFATRMQPGDYTFVMDDGASAIPF